MGFACVTLNIACIGGLHPIPRDQKDNGVAAMLDDRTFCSVIQHGRHTVVFWISRDWLQTTYSPFNWLSETEGHQEDITKDVRTYEKSYEKSRICIQMKQ